MSRSILKECEHMMFDGKNMNEILCFIKDTMVCEDLFIMNNHMKYGDYVYIDNQAVFILRLDNERFDAIDTAISDLDFSQEWLDDIDKKIAELYDDIKDFNITASLLAGETIGYLQELKALKLALAPVSTDKQT